MLKAKRYLGGASALKVPKKAPVGSGAGAACRGMHISASQPAETSSSHQRHDNPGPRCECESLLNGGLRLELLETGSGSCFHVKEHPNRSPQLEMSAGVVVGSLVVRCVGQARMRSQQ